MEAVAPDKAVGITAPPHTYPPLRTAAVLGAGTMGSQIAAHLANAGMDVYLLDMSGDKGRNALSERGLQNAKKLKPNPFFLVDYAKRIETGNFEDHFDYLAEADWVVEAVVERLDVKRSLMERVEAVVRDDAIISTNTSGLGIGEIARGRSESFRHRFLGTHFFNPPRYLKLLELVPSTDTDPEIVARMAHFGRIHLGKGVVIAKDTPYFIGNRIGVYAMLQAMRSFTEGDYSIEEIDALTGPLTGRPKSATFRTADVVGLDVMLDVAENLRKAIPEDESRDAFRAPQLLKTLVEKKRLGQKSDQGFYKKVGKEIKSVEPDSLEYSAHSEMNLPDLQQVEEAGDLSEKLRVLFDAEGRGGAFFRLTTLDLLGYSARRIPEITETPANVDRAIQWGFGWELGPFQIWDSLGFATVLEAMRAEGIQVPSWVDEMEAAGRNAFYEEAECRPAVYVPIDQEYREDPGPPDELSLDVIRRWDHAEIESYKEGGLLDIGEGVALYEFRSKANTLGAEVMAGLREAIDRVEKDRRFKGLVVGNDGKNFSVGANLVEVVLAVENGSLEAVEEYLKEFQTTIQRVRYARKPVVVAVHQRVLGGACEMMMACAHPVAAAESYCGLVELGVGLIPAGTGTTRLAAAASDRTPNKHPSEVQAWLRTFFEAVVMARVSTSAAEAMEIGFLPTSGRIVMNAERRLYVAREMVQRLSSEGYFPPTGKPIRVGGRPTRAAFEVMVQQYQEGDFISEYDAHLANRFVYVLTGGDLTAPQDVPEDYLLQLERDVFLDLLQNDKTQARIEHMLKTKKPLRN